MSLQLGKMGTQREDYSAPGHRLKQDYAATWRTNCSGSAAAWCKSGAVGEAACRGYQLSFDLRFWQGITDLNLSGVWPMLPAGGHEGSANSTSWRQLLLGNWRNTIMTMFQSWNQENIEILAILWRANGKTALPLSLPFQHTVLRLAV